MCQPGRPRPRPVSQAGSPGRSRLPEQAVERVLLAGALGVSPAVGEHLEHLLAGPAGHLAERRVAGHREVEVGRRPGRRDVVHAPGLLQPLHHVDDQRDRLDRADVVVGREHAQGLHVGAEQLGLTLGQGDPVLAGRVGPFEERVVDVGDVLHVAHVVAGRAPGAVEQVEGDVRRGVAHVGGVVRRDPADVHPGGSVRGGHLAQRAGGAVEDPDGRSACAAGKGPRLGRGPRTHVADPIGPPSEGRPRDGGPATRRDREAALAQQPLAAPLDRVHLAHREQVLQPFAQVTVQPVDDALDPVSLLR